MTEATQEKFQRKTVLVKRSLQIKYIALLFGVILIAVVLIGGDLLLTLSRIVSSDNPALLPLLEKVKQMLLVKTILYLGIIVAASLIMSNRIAGPIYRFEQSAQVVGSGDLTHRVRLRTGDELMELQDEFNDMVSSLQGKARQDKNLASRLALQLDRAASGSAVPEDVRKELLSLKAELEHIASGFKV